MAMNKKEQAEMDALRQELALHKAMRLSDGERLQPLPVLEMLEESPGSLLIGWFEHNYDLSWHVSQGCSNQGSHSIDDIRQTSRQTCGRPYAKRSEALKAARWDVARRAAEALVRLDSEIARTEQKEATGEYPVAYVKKRG